MTMTRSAAVEFATSYTAAWNSGKPDSVAAHYAADGEIVINRGLPSTGHVGVAAMAAGFHADVPDLSLVCDDVRVAGNHVVYVWTFTGHHAGTGRPLSISGWEEWDFDAEGRVLASRGWYDAADYARQVAGV